MCQPWMNAQCADLHSFQVQHGTAPLPWNSCQGTHRMSRPSSTLMSLRCAWVELDAWQSHSTFLVHAGTDKGAGTNTNMPALAHTQKHAQGDYLIDMANPGQVQVSGMFCCVFVCMCGCRSPWVDARSEGMQGPDFCVIVGMSCSFVKVPSCLLYRVRGCQHSCRPGIAPALLPNALLPPDGAGAHRAAAAAGGAGEEPCAAQHVPGRQAHRPQAHAASPAAHSRAAEPAHGWRGAVCVRRRAPERRGLQIQVGVLLLAVHAVPAVCVESMWRLTGGVGKVCSVG